MSRYPSSVLWLASAHLAVVTAIFLPSASAAHDQGADQVVSAIRPESLRAHVEFLGDDLLEGRRTGTVGYDIAARYVAAEFAQIGLRPVSGTWFQTVPLRSTLPDEQTARVTLTTPQGERTLKSRLDYVLEGSFAQSADIDAPVAYVRYGITAPELAYDDYAGLDVAGKVVALRRGAPDALPVDARTFYAGRKIQMAAKHGAVAVLYLDEGAAASDWSVLVSDRAGVPRLAWLDGDTPHDEPSVIRAVAWLNGAVSSELLGVPPSPSVGALADRSRDLAARVRMKVDYRLASLSSANVLGVLQGSDPVRRDQYVVVSAHIDHLGVGRAVAGDSIYNGVVDNASGVAALIEIARALAGLHPAPSRSILFLGTTAEEAGSVGADFFVSRPPVDAAMLVANVNVDGASVWPFEGLTVRGADESTLASAVSRAASAGGFSVAAATAGQPPSLDGSDQYAFVVHAVPSVIFGARRTPAARALALDWVKTRYHQPSDDLSQPLDYNASAVFTRNLAMVVLSIAQDPQRPTWVPGSFWAHGR